MDEKETLMYEKGQTIRKRAKNKIFGVIYSRTAVVIILLLLQIELMLFSLTYLENYTNYLYGVFVILSVVSVIYIMNEKGTPEFKMTWLLFILLVPVVGVGFYIFTKTEFGTHFLGKRLEDLRHETEPYMEQNEGIVQTMRSSRLANVNLSHFLYQQVGFPTYGNTEATYFPLGDDKFPALLAELEKAEKFIFMEYFIIEKGEIWNSIHEVLKAKVKDGIKVRLMYDDLGTISRLPSNFYKKLRKEGIECVKFNEYSQFASALYNNRDHRKITVIDGKVGYMGGINIADEYANINCSYGFWKDSAVKLVGDGVNGLTCILLQLYGIQTGNIENYSDYFVKNNEKAQGIVCPFGDGPKYFYGEHIGENLYINLISQAKKTIFITTPYLIIDSELRDALINASNRGVDVRIVTPHIPDKKVIFSITRSHYKILQDSGIKIFEFKKGFIHSKQILIDNELSIVGTINLDYRSMIHHYECGVLMYNTSCIKDIEKDFENIFENSIDMKDFKQMWIAKIFCALIKLFTPLF